MSSTWTAFDAGLEPADEFVGPFPQSGFLDAWWTHLGEGDPVSVVGSRAAMPLVVESGVVKCAGATDVTDYHSPLGDDFGELARLLLDLSDQVGQVQLDSLAGVSARGLEKALGEEGREPIVSEVGSTAVIVVDGGYLDQLAKKQRHELRRKHRRFVETWGEPEFSHSAPGSLERFTHLHRQSEGAKGRFLDGPMEDFFSALAGQPGWAVSEMTVGGDTAASFFGFREPDAYYLYNSAFDPHYREVSPGIVALYLLIEELVNEGCRRIDLLKGDEAYKARLGAEKRPLFTVAL
jgi:CelD/BcsL family acetyltransferase involved in cellulose biosynthesis